MSDASEKLVETITQDLQCPQCEYNLRGLQGAFIACPECGLELDVAKLVAERWDKPWYRAPGFSYITGTVGVALLCVPGALLVLGMMVELMDNGWRSFDPNGIFLTGAALLLGPMAWWAFRLRRIRRKWGPTAILHALLAHALFAGYFASGVGAFAIVGFAVGGGSWAASPFILIEAAIVVAVLWVCRRGERYIAEQCIRRHLASRVMIAVTEND